MESGMFFKGSFAALVAGVVCTAAAFAAPPLEAYGRLPSLDHVGLAPDVKTIAYVKEAGAKRVLVIQVIGAKDPLTIQDISDIHDKGGQKLRGIFWADSTHLVILNSATTTVTGLGIQQLRQEHSTAEVYDIQSKTVGPLLTRGRGLKDSYGTLNVIAGGITPRVVEGRSVVYVVGYYFRGTDGHGQTALFRVDLQSGETRLASREVPYSMWGQPDQFEAEGWLLDPAGKILAEEDFNEKTAQWKLVLYRDGAPDKTAMEVHAPIEQPGMVALGEDGASVIVEMPETIEGKSYKLVSLKDGSITPWRPELAHAGDLVTDHRINQIIGVTHIVDKSDYNFFEPRWAALWKSVKAAFAGATNVELASVSDDKTKAVVEVFGPQLGAGYFFIDLEAKKAYPVGSAYDGINEFYEEKWITYSAADGRKISGYLTLPKGGDAKNLPLVVLPHGGPQARDEPGFDWLSQSIASRGYAVLQPEFRGSDGFGWEWLSSGFGEWGKKMQTDLSDGVRALAAQGVIDPKRVCIVGASYGGYAALAGATLDTGVYRCAVSIAGISDMMDLVKGGGLRKIGGGTARYMERYTGTEDGKYAKLDAISPIKFIDKVSIPILLIHGKDDTRVQFSQSEDMADALKSAGKPYEFVILDNEDHFLSTGKTRLQMLDATVKFLEKYNPPNQSTAAN
jgi:dienelactone hydrolase